MPRRPRIVVPNISLHIIQRGNNKQACFFADDDYLFYLQWLEEYALTSGCLIHAYVLITNHVHLLLTPKSSSSAGDLLKRLGQRYVQYINMGRKISILPDSRGEIVVDMSEVHRTERFINQALCLFCLNFSQQSTTPPESKIQKGLVKAQVD